MPYGFQFSVCYSVKIIHIPPVKSFHQLHLEILRSPGQIWIWQVKEQHDDEYDQEHHKGDYKGVAEYPQRGFQAACFTEYLEQDVIYDGVTGMGISMLNIEYRNMAPLL